MNDGLLGIGYAHSMLPPRSSPKESALISARWTTYWEPRCVLQSKRSDDPADDFSILQSAFHRRIRALLAANITWSVIRSGDLDSPLRTGTEFSRALCLAIERRRCRIGWSRKKGARKHHAHAK